MSCKTLKQALARYEAAIRLQGCWQPNEIAGDFFEPHFLKQMDGCTTPIPLRQQSQEEQEEEIVLHHSSHIRVIGRHRVSMKSLKPKARKIHDTGLSIGMNLSEKVQEGQPRIK